MHSVLGIEAALFAVLAVVSVVTLRHVPATGASAPANASLDPAPTAA
jgi:hypothetical protein